MRLSQIKTVNCGSKFEILEFPSLHQCSIMLEMIFMLFLCHNSLACLFRVGLIQTSAVGHKMQSNQDLQLKRKHMGSLSWQQLLITSFFFFFFNFLQRNFIKAHLVYWPEWPNRCYFQVVFFGRHRKVHLFSLFYDHFWEDISEECLV